ncbi:hypothetical protein [Maribacter sp. 2210JD10-5]|uniref:hypothetical protein n=1 Tax=Maribacter sp. 2210JD10-5 TaxID=3386272 RepID=UPI0039BCBAC8
MKNIKNIKYIFMLCAVVLSMGCEEEFNRTLDFQFVEFARSFTGSSTNVTVPNLGQTIRDSVLIQVVGPSNDPVTINWDIDIDNTNAVEGVHYQLVTENPITVPAGESFTSIYFDIILDGFGTTQIPDEIDMPRNITFRISDSSVGVQPNVNTINHLITPICPSCLTIWTGPDITFTKADMADWTLPENQDRITDNVWITRQNQWSIFNIAQGDISAFTPCDNNDPGGGQPVGTLWALGSTDDVASLTFDSFLGTFCQPGRNLPLNTPIVLFLVDEEIYIDIQFLSWTSGGNAGGFSYIRSTEN